MTYKVKREIKGNHTIIKDACLDCGITHSVQDHCNCRCHEENKISTQDLFNMLGE